MAITHRCMELVQDFFNKLASDLQKKYFPNLKYYRDNKDCAGTHYSIELFSNGVITYNVLINRLSKSCKDTKKNIKVMVDKYIKL